MICLCWEVFTAREFERAAYTIFGLMYVPMMFGYLMLFQNLRNGEYFIWMVFVAALLRRIPSRILSDACSREEARARYQSEQDDLRFCRGPCRFSRSDDRIWSRDDEGFLNLNSAAGLRGPRRRGVRRRTARRFIRFADQTTL